MAWYDAISTQIGDAYTQAVDKAGDLLGDYIDVSADRKSESLRQVSYDTSAREAQAAAKGPFFGGLDWQKWGVIVGALGVSLAVYKMVKK